MSRGLKKPLANTLTVVFALLCVFHIAGALGAWRSFAIIPSAPGMERSWPSSLSWMAVAAALALASVVSLARGDLILRSLPKWMSTFACCAMAAVFLLRAVGDFYVLGVFKSVTETPFAYWDTRLYTPLCLAIGSAALLLAATPRTRQE